MARKKKKNYVAEDTIEEVVEDVTEEVVAEEAPAVEIEEVVEIEEPAEEVVEIEEAAEVEEVVEEAAEEVVEVEPLGMTSNTPDYSYDAWWNEIGLPLKRKGYSLPGVVNRAKKAFGSEFDEDRFQAYRIANFCGKDIQKNVEAIWNSQK